MEQLQVSVLPEVIELIVYLGLARDDMPGHVLVDAEWGCVRSLVTVESNDAADLLAGLLDGRSDLMAAGLLDLVATFTPLPGFDPSGAVIEADADHMEVTAILCDNTQARVWASYQQGALL